jgi:hypothetical protein
VHFPAAHVGVPFAHAEHAPPFAPHASLLVPATQVAPLQHPLQMLPVPHDFEHEWVVALHAWPAGQSVATLQPTPVPESGDCVDPELGVAMTRLATSLDKVLGLKSTERMHVALGASDVVHVLDAVGTE